MSPFNKYPVITAPGIGCFSLTINAASGSNVPSLTVAAGADLTIAATLNNSGIINVNVDLSGLPQLMVVGALTNTSTGNITVKGILEAQDQVFNANKITSEPGGTFRTIGTFTNQGTGSVVINGTVENQADVVNDGSISSGTQGLLLLTNTVPSTISGAGTTLLTDVTFSAGATNALSTTQQVRVSRIAKVQTKNVTANGKLRLTSNPATTTGMIYAVTTTGAMQGNVSIERSISPKLTGQPHQNFQPRFQRLGAL